MNLSRFAVPFALAALLAVAGCGTTPLPEPAKPTPVAAPAAAAPAAPAARAATAMPAPAAQAAVRTVTLHPLDDPKSELVKRSVYFDFDSVALHDADRPVLESHARYMARAGAARVRVEGNADERGGREYNLALGQRRAEAVIKALQLLGAPTARMEAISYGREKPVDPGHDETAWAKNRRADLNYLAR